MNKYVFKPYNDIFPILFENEKNRLCKFLKRKYFIEHVGSTAIPGASGKGIIDIMISTEKEEIPQIFKQLEEADYEYREMASKPERLFFRIDIDDLIEEKRRYHVHLVPAKNNEWMETLKFRDYMLKHPEKVHEYNNLKIQAVKESNQNGKIYRKIKEPFIKNIISQ
ncbi:MAG: GrpB family protein [Parcubacteria group bacterium]